MVALVNSGTSFLAGFAVFSTLGFMAKQHVRCEIFMLRLKLGVTRFIRFRTQPLILLPNRALAWYLSFIRRPFLYCPWPIFGTPCFF